MMYTDLYGMYFLTINSFSCGVKYSMNYWYMLGVLCVLELSGQSVFITVHGTWSSECAWYMPGGDFFDALEKSVLDNDGVVIPFSWSGANSVDAREKAGRNLAKIIDSYDGSSARIIVVAHSHGGNVALLASHALKKNKIDILYTLGTPINSSIYPNMDMINFCYNLFSFEDLIQPVFGMFAREHVPHARIGNIRVVLNGKEPDHAQLHNPIVGHWLASLHDIIKKEIGSGVIYFDNTKTPLYALDKKREELLERDYKLSLLMLSGLRNSFDIGSRTPLTNL